MDPFRIFGAHTSYLISVKVQNSGALQCMKKCLRTSIFFSYSFFELRCFHASSEGVKYKKNEAEKVLEKQLLRLSYELKSCTHE